MFFVLLQTLIYLFIRSEYVGYTLTNQIRNRQKRERYKDCVFFICFYRCHNSFIRCTIATGPNKRMKCFFFVSHFSTQTVFVAALICFFLISVFLIFDLIAKRVCIASNMSFFFLFYSFRFNLLIGMIMKHARLG